MLRLLQRLTLLSEMKLDNYLCLLKKIIGGVKQSMQIQEQCE